MHLTKEEEKMLNGEFGEAKQASIKLLIRYAEALNAEKLVEVQSVHTIVAATSEIAPLLKGNYPLLNEILLCSPSPLELDEMEVFTTTHVSNIEPKYYKEFEISDQVLQIAFDIRNHYSKKGIIFTCSCTPYLVGNIPVKGNHIAWMESSAVVYANSVIGALGNIEGIESTLAAGITGKIPYAGFHIPENRKAKVLFQVEADLNNRTDFDALGYFIGEELENIGMGLEVPILTGMNPLKITQDSLKGMGASMATSGAVQLYHIEGVTPEACMGLEKIVDDLKRVEKIKVDDKNINGVYQKLSTADDNKVDLVVLGCPHYSINQIKKVALLLNGKKVKDDVELWIFTPSALRDLSISLGFGKMIENAGGKLMCDTCPAITRSKPVNIDVMACDSPKQIHYYTAEFPKLKTWFGTVEECIDAAITGIWGGN
ncbi:MAG: aconitase X [Candidatus Helarchaeota archaeon]